MGKRKRSSTLQLEGITEDGILCSIISSLTLRDAVRTCAVSSRWRHIWTHVPYLNFDAANMFDRATLHLLNRPDHSWDEHVALWRERTEEFIGSVDSVLQNHQGVGVEALRVNYFLRKNHSDQLDRWVCFGVASKTKELVLNLEPPLVPFPTEEPYDFPCQLFTKQRGSSIERLSLSFCSLKPPSEFDGFNHLKVLDLVDVSVTEEDIKRLLSNCLTLERLSVTGSQELVKLNISHPLSQLKYLKVEYCNQLREIKFNATNLATFGYTGGWVDFIFREASQLAKAYISFTCGWDAMGFALTTLPSNLPHLKTLFLHIQGVFKVAGLPENSNRFIHLRHLVLILWIGYNKDANLLALASLLNAAPFMEKFELHQQIPMETFEGYKRIRRLSKCPHTHLKTVEFGGFLASRCQIEFAIYLLNNAIELEMMTLNSRFRPYDGCGKWEKKQFRIEPREVLKRAIEYLSPEVSSKAKLVII